VSDIWYRCPLCGRQVRAYEIEKAGSHHIEGIERQSMGRHGFEHIPVELEDDEIAFLYEAVMRVKEQLEEIMKERI